MAVIDVAFSDLINKPKVTLQPLAASHATSIRLRRRDEADLMLTTADRYEQEHEVIRMAVRLFATLARQRDLDSMLRLLPEIYPWTRFLPEPDQSDFLREFIDTLGAIEDLDTVAPLVQLITEWRHTAEVHADPALVAILTGNLGDFGAVPPPPGA
jgi:hypothetical protein